MCTYSPLGIPFLLASVFDYRMWCLGLFMRLSWGCNIAAVPGGFRTRRIMAQVVWNTKTTSLKKSLVTLEPRTVVRNLLFTHPSGWRPLKMGLLGLLLFTYLCPALRRCGWAQVNTVPQVAITESDQSCGIYFRGHRTLSEKFWVETEPSELTSQVWTWLSLYFLL